MVMTWLLMWLNVSVATLNATLRLLNLLVVNRMSFKKKKTKTKTKTKQNIKKIKNKKIK